MSDDPVAHRHRTIAELDNWRHQIDVGYGVVTPGTRDLSADARHLRLPRDLTGKRVLDVGASDGWFSFTCEDAGATDILAIDDLSSTLNAERNGFTIAAELRESKARFEACDVVDLDPERHGQFDLILFLNVLYHLPNPMLALERLAAVLAPGGTLLLKTYFRSDVRVWFRGRAFQFDIDRRPKAWFFPNDELAGDPTNWWGPNRRCIEAFLEAVGLESEMLAVDGDRVYYAAKN